jgi:hypothetical protein
VLGAASSRASQSGMCGFWHCVSHQQQRRSGAALSSALEHSLRPPPTKTPNTQAAAATGDDDRRPQAHVLATSRIAPNYGYVPSVFCNLYFPSRRARLPHFALCLRAARDALARLGGRRTIGSVGPGFQGAPTCQTSSEICPSKKWLAGIGARAFCRSKNGAITRCYAAQCSVH